MLSPFNSSALKKAAKQSCKLTAGPQNQDKSHLNAHQNQPSVPALYTSVQVIFALGDGGGGGIGA
jgi:hypothetical protein